MRIAIGTDHAGFSLKSRLVAELEGLGHQVLDCGASDDRVSDYPDFTRKVARSLLDGKAERGVLLCGSGVGSSIAANKFPGIRAGLCHDSYSARQGVEHDAMNVLCMGGRVIGPELAAEILRSFVGAAPAMKERHARRLAKVNAIEAAARSGQLDLGSP